MMTNPIFPTPVEADRDTANMIRIVEQHFFDGPSIYSKQPCLIAVLDMANWQYLSVNAVPGFSASLCACLPELARYRCLQALPLGGGPGGGCSWTWMRRTATTR
ncbi:hypothetical protein FNU76_01215 [Chitinimonas arctica]|uniref:Uncharacterized protein n=1 Tax=Chitinimonas arctica TaxID=2594795 RepID=A0A516SAA4_9NEIS|nr:hypothetical protein [Chitinimonas arctica]QDQ25080.1 hypothetical protein FNU76_01215 [Chitinimonas arctica]